jgi:hypothetical protein
MTPALSNIGTGASQCQAELAEADSDEAARWS